MVYTFIEAPTIDFEYLWIINDANEALVDDAVTNLGLECVGNTDYYAYANRKWSVGDPEPNDTAASCASCDDSGVLLTLNLNCYDPDGDGTVNTPDSVTFHGPFNDWETTYPKFATDNGDGTWSYHIPKTPSEDFEYLWLVDETQEEVLTDILDGGSCNPEGTGFDQSYFSSDSSTYASRLWIAGSGDIEDIYDTCETCEISTSTPPPFPLIHPVLKGRSTPLELLVLILEIGILLKQVQQQTMEMEHGPIRLNLHQKRIPNTNGSSMVHRKIFWMMFKMVMVLVLP